MKKLILFVLLASLTCSIGQAQIRFVPEQPDDVLNPASDDGIPDVNEEFLNDSLPQDLLDRLQFRFDAVLDPQRISIIDFVGRNGINDVRLDNATRSIIRNHLIALQQVELSIRFLQANRDQIINGENEQFKSVFGTVGVRENVAVLSPAPLAGTASLQTTQGAIFPTATLMFQAAPGGGGGGGGQQGGMVDRSEPNVSSQILPGDILFVEDPAAVGGMPGITTNTRTTGIVVRAAQVMGNDPASASAGGGGGGNTMQEVILDPTFGSALNTMTQFNNARVFRVLRFDRQFSSRRYEKVLATFEAIRASLLGLDPAVTTAGGLQGSLQDEINYQRGFEDINTIWQPGVAEYIELNDTVMSFMNRRRVDPTSAPLSGPTMLRGADRLVRQAGFSNSDSHTKIRNQFAQFDSRFNEYPLLWTEDNNLRPLNGAFAGPVDSNDEGRAFFFDQQKLFSQPNNVQFQYLGRAFLAETERHESFHFDDQVRSEGLATATTTLLLPNGQPIQVLIGEPESGLNPTDVPEGELDPNSTRTEFRKWQMIIESFSEYSTDIGATNLAGVPNNAFIGVAELFGGFAAGDASGDDAGNFARFAGLIGTSSLGGIDFSRIEPLGKRGRAGFNPVVPVQ